MKKAQKPLRRKKSAINSQKMMMRKELRKVIPNCLFIKKYETEELKIFKKMMEEFKIEDDNNEIDEVKEIYGDLGLEDESKENSSQSNMVSQSIS